MRITTPKAAVAAVLVAGLVVVVVLVAVAVVGSPAAQAERNDPTGEKLRVWLQQDDASNSRHLAQAVVDCMKRAGFPGYVKVGAPPPTTAPDGYGISTTVDVHVAPTPDVLTFVKPLDSPDAAKAFFGEVRLDDDTPTSAHAPAPSGCAAKAQASVVGHQDAWDVVEQDVASIEQRVTDDPTVVAKTKVWAACFQAATGVTFPSPEFVRQFLADQAFRLTAKPGDDSTPGEGIPATASELEHRVASLQQLQATERSWAATDAKCAASSGLDVAKRRATDALLGAVARKDRSQLEEVGFRG